LDPVALPGLDMTASFMHRVVIEHVRSLLEDVPRPARSALLRELAQSLLAMIGDPHTSGAILPDSPEDAKNGE
jgi:hypothetical protein